MFYLCKRALKTKRGATDNKGFTLVEMVVVIVILGIIAAIAVPSFIGYIDRSRVTSAATDAAQLASSLNTLNLAMSGTLPTENLPSHETDLRNDLVAKNLYPQLSGEFGAVLGYITYNNTTRLFEPLPDNVIRERMG